MKVKWIHDFPDEPEWLYSELDQAYWEIRKVEVFPDGTTGYAGLGEEVGSTGLSLESIPSLEEIASDPQFLPTEMSREEFEDVWAKRHDRVRT